MYPFIQNIVIGVQRKLHNFIVSKAGRNATDVISNAKITIPRLAKQKRNMSCKSIDKINWICTKAVKICAETRESHMFKDVSSEHVTKRRYQRRIGKTISIFFKRSDSFSYLKIPSNWYPSIVDSIFLIESAFTYYSLTWHCCRNYIERNLEDGR